MSLSQTLPRIQTRRIERSAKHVEVTSNSAENAQGAPLCVAGGRVERVIHIAAHGPLSARAALASLCACVRDRDRDWYMLSSVRAAATAKDSSAARACACTGPVDGNAEVPSVRAASQRRIDAHVVSALHEVVVARLLALLSHEESLRHGDINHHHWRLEKRGTVAV